MMSLRMRELAMLGLRVGVALLGGFVAGNLQSDVFVVDSRNRSGLEDGSPGAPFTTIGSAIGVGESGDMILVALGEYRENLMIIDKAISIQGGYLGGTEENYSLGVVGDFEVSDPLLNPTVVQALNALNPTVSIVNAAGSVRGTLIDGMIIRGGRHGVLLRDETDPPTMRDVVISNNVIENNGIEEFVDGHRGGGILVESAAGDIRIENNTIRGNWADRGSGIALLGQAEGLVVRRNQIQNNISLGDHGGGIYAVGKGVIEENLIEGNIVGAGADFGYGWGGGVLIFAEADFLETEFVMARNIIRHNEAPTGGGGVMVDDGAVVAMRNELIYGNQSIDRAGGVFADGAEEELPPRLSRAELIHCTVADNEGSEDAANGLVAFNSVIEARLCILWGNQGTATGVGEGPNLPGTGVFVTESLSQESETGSSNLSEDPLFADPSAGEFHLKSTGGRWEIDAASDIGQWVVDRVNSPAIDAGPIGEAVNEEPEPNGGRVNLGAFGGTLEASKTGQDPTEEAAVWLIASANHGVAVVDHPTVLRAGARGGLDTVVEIEFFVDDLSVGVDRDPSDGWAVSWTPNSGNEVVVSVVARTSAGAHAEAMLTTLNVIEALPVHAAIMPNTWEPRGVGGGGALFSPAISPFDPLEMFVACDMGQTFHTTSGGQRWETLDFRQIHGGNITAPIQFTRDPNILYAIDFEDSVDTWWPVRSDDSGRTWTRLEDDPTFGAAYSLYADPASSDRILLSSYNTLYLSENGGRSFQVVYEADDLHIGGVFFHGNTIAVGARPGLILSTDDGASFALADIPGLPRDQEIISMAGAADESVVRLICVTLEQGSVYPGVTGADNWPFGGIYTLNLDDENSIWRNASSGLNPDHRMFFVGMARNNAEVAYVAGQNWDGVSAPAVYKTSDGGQSWLEVFLTENNENVTTGWQGDRGDRQWSYGEYALGLAVAPMDANRVLLTDLGFVHLTEDGGQNWRQAYVDAQSENVAGQSTPQERSYRSVGLEPTSTWWLEWLDEQTMFASATDITGIRSQDGGATWGFDFSGQEYNSSYQTTRDPLTGRVYMAVSGVHDLYESTYLSDDDIDWGNGAVLYSDDQGQSWNMLHDFEHPVVALALDPNDTSRLYCSVVHRREGGIYLSENVQAGPRSSWVRLPEPPRTEGHAYSIHVLHDGSIVSSYSGRRTDDEDPFTPSSGVFLLERGANEWKDRSDSRMRYWMRDLVLDPHDPSQNTWYACVFNGFGGAANDLGGVYLTVDRGRSWKRIVRDLSVRSVAVHPVDPNVAYVTTERQGLWSTTNLSSADPAFKQEAKYPFHNPTRVFFKPGEIGEVWVTSFGNGLRVGSGGSEPTALQLVLRGWQGDGFSLDLIGGSGQSAIISASIDLSIWDDIAEVQLSAEPTNYLDRTAGSVSQRFYRARLK